MSNELIDAVDKRTKELSRVLNVKDEANVTKHLLNTVQAYIKERKLKRDMFGASEIPMEERTNLRAHLIDINVLNTMLLNILGTPCSTTKLSDFPEKKDAAPKEKVVVKPKTLGQALEDSKANAKGKESPSVKSPTTAAKAAESPASTPASDGFKTASQLSEEEKQIAKAQEANAKAVEKNSTDKPKEKKPAKAKKDSDVKSEPEKVCPKCGKVIKLDDAVEWKDGVPQHQTCPGEGNRKPKPRKCKVCSCQLPAGEKGDLCSACKDEAELQRLKKQEADYKASTNVAKEL
jgi:hypothetical protein